MGLDMYMVGFENDDTVNDSLYRHLELAYWRKHPNLHGYIVNTFANGIDDCHPIVLTKENLHNILNAIKDCRLPKTEGFFFGESLREYKKTDIEKLTFVINWINAEPNRKIIYQASW